MVGMFILCYVVGLFALSLMALMDWADGDKENGSRLFWVALTWPFYLVSTIVQMVRYDPQEGENKNDEV